MPEPIGAPHACEIEYCMGNLDLKERLRLDCRWLQSFRNYAELLRQLHQNRDPNGEKSSRMASLLQPNDATPPVMILDTESKAVKYNDARYLFWIEWTSRFWTKNTRSPLGAQRMFFFSGFVFLIVFYWKLPYSICNSSHLSTVWFNEVQGRP